LYSLGSDIPPKLPPIPKTARLAEMKQLAILRLTYATAFTISHTILPCISVVLNNDDSFEATGKTYLI